MGTRANPDVSASHHPDTPPGATRAHWFLRCSPHHVAGVGCHNGSRLITILLSQKKKSAAKKAPVKKAIAKVNI